MLPDATQVADPFHLVKLANTKVDEVRRRVQNETLGHRGRKTDPLYRCRRLLTKADERLDDAAAPSCSACSTPATQAARCAWPGTRRKSSGRSTTTPTSSSPTQFVDRLGHDLQDAVVPAGGPSARAAPSLRWRDQIVAWHRAHVSNGPTEAVNNLIKRVKRVAFGMTRFRNFRIRVLLYAGRPNWDLLPTITPR